MINNIKTKVFAIVSIISAAVFSVFAASSGLFDGKGVFTSSNSYEIVMNSSSNKLHANTGATSYSGTSTVKTGLGNGIELAYSDAMGLSTTWHVFKDGGCFYNVNPINSLESIKLSFKTDSKDFAIHWAFAEDFSDEKTETLTSSSTQPLTFDFDAEKPRFFKFENTSGVNINVSEVVLSYSCEVIGQNVFVSYSSEQGTVTGDGFYPVGSLVTIGATPFEGYEFDSFEYSMPATVDGNAMTFRMPRNDVYISAFFEAKEYQFTLTNNHLDMGSASIRDESDDGLYAFGSSMQITATPSRGSAFVGWYDSNESLISQDNPYSFSMPHENIEYHPAFEWTQYAVDVSVNDESMGHVVGAGSYVFGQTVTLTAFPEPGYSLFGWYDGNELLSQDETYSFTMSDNSLSLRVVFAIGYRLGIFSDAEAKGTVSGPAGLHAAGTKVTVTCSPKEGYAFDCWYDDDLNNSFDEVYTFTMPSYDFNVYASFADESQGYHLYLSSSDESKGTVSPSGIHLSGRNVTVVAVPTDDCVFDGWYHDNSEVSDEAAYTFTMPFNDYSLVACFEARATKYGTRPILSEDGKTITYGLYPQKNVNDSTLVSALNALTTPESNGWYLYNNDYYAKVSATPNSSSYVFDNGTTIVSGTTYWFKCEPITWNVLNNEEGEYYILSSVLLDLHCYYNSSSNRIIDGKTVYANNYEYSDIRSWLNNDFYNSAFALGNSHIQTTTVDNGAATTDSSSNPYACNNTQDKVFLPSFQDYINSSYGFSTSTEQSDTRYCKTTDWARAKGAKRYAVTLSPLYNGAYWTRSPRSDIACHVLLVTDAGSCGGGSLVYETNLSVRPAMTIKIA